MFMRKLLVILMATALVQTCPAQSQDTSSRVFKKFKVDISVGYASPSGSSSSSQGSQFNGGALFAIEPKFAVIDPLAIGVRVEAAVIAHTYTNNYSSNNSNGKANLSGLLTADYYFTNSGFRPFIGAGGGIYSTATIDSNTVNSNSTVPYTSQFGFMARAGFELGHLRIGAEYNFVSNNASYLGLKIGVCLGGGRKRK
jgi:outer membrane protein W